MWIYNDIELIEIPEKAIGFVYLIEDTLNNKKYIGKKLFRFLRKKNNKRIKVESDWKNYYGSNDKLKEQVILNDKSYFSRKILRICYSKTECSYYETKFIFEADALLSTEYYNDWVTCKITRKHCSAIK